MRHKWSGIALICSLSCSTVIAQEAGKSTDRTIWAPPRLIQSGTTPKPTIRKPMIGNLRIAGFEIVLEKTRMGQVQKKFGGELGSEGDAGDFLEWLCVHGSDKSGSWVMWLESGEIDAGSVGGFQWRRVDRGAIFDGRCSVLPKAPSLIELPVALRLGMTEANVLRVLGPPTVREGSALLYIETHEEWLRKESFWEYNAVTVVIQDGAVSAIEAQKSTTS
jgi:hypothetical protein